MKCPDIVSNASAGGLRLAAGAARGVLVALAAVALAVLGLVLQVLLGSA